MLKIRVRGRTPIDTQRALRSGKSGTRQSAAQVVVWIRVTAGKMRAGEPENGLDPSLRHSLRQQVSGDPQIDDAQSGGEKRSVILQPCTQPR